MKLGTVTATVAIFCSTGCTVLPSVEYREITEASHMAGMTDAFYRQDSLIRITAPAPSVGKAGSTTAAMPELTITSVPADYVTSKVGIRAITDWRSSTVININKEPNTDRLKSIGTEVTDTTAKSITAYGGAILKAVALMDAPPTKAVAPPAPAQCVAPGDQIDVRLGNEKTTNKEQHLKSPKACIVIKLKEAPPDAAPGTAMPWGQRSHNFYYSACREAEVEVAQHAGKEPIKVQVRVADPNFIQFVQFPPTGKITMHSECGVSVQTDKGAVDNGAAIIEAVTGLLKTAKEGSGTPK